MSETPKTDALEKAVSLGMIGSQLFAEVKKLEKALVISARDSCATDTECRNSARRVLGAWVDGDSHGVPPLETVVERLVQRIEFLETPNE